MSPPTPKVAIPEPVLLTIFFLSGMAALLYQLIWQRALFTIYGTNTESVTIVVAAFMLGLGVGSLLGGEFSKRVPKYLVLAFALIEVAIGLYGAVSLYVFTQVGLATLGASTWMTGLLSFGVVLVPTALMGATLPLLVAHLVGQNPNVGRSVGRLYFANTIGSAMACFAAAHLVFVHLGMHAAVWLAVALNLLVAATILALHYLRRAPRCA